LKVKRACEMRAVDGYDINHCATEREEVIMMMNLPMLRAMLRTRPSCLYPDDMNQFMSKNKLSVSRRHELLEGVFE
jgi:hypothetical protein